MLICGAGGHAKVVLDILRYSKISVLGIFGKHEEIVELEGIPILNEYNPDFHPDSDLIIATGDNQLRKKISFEIKHRFGQAIHPSALISKTARIGEGAVIVHNSVIQTSTILGQHVIINTSASVDHDCKIADFVHISPKATLCGGVEVGAGSLIGANAVIIPNKKVGEWCIIGAGSVVIDDIPDYSLAVGNPAKVIKKLEINA